MSEYSDELSKLKSSQCIHCYGSGKCDDSDLGDISCNEWECTHCRGTGFADGVYSSHIIIDKRSKT